MVLRVSRQGLCQDNTPSALGSDDYMCNARDRDGPSLERRSRPHEVTTLPHDSDVQRKV